MRRMDKRGELFIRDVSLIDFENGACELLEFCSAKRWSKSNLWQFKAREIDCSAKSDMSVIWQNRTNVLFGKQFKSWVLQRGLSRYENFGRVTQKKVKYQSWEKKNAAYNAENRSVCQRSGFFVSEMYWRLPTKVLRTLLRDTNGQLIKELHNAYRTRT